MCFHFHRHLFIIIFFLSDFILFFYILLNIKKAKTHIFVCRTFLIKDILILTFRPPIFYLIFYFIMMLLWFAEVSFLLTSDMAVMTLKTANLKYILAI